MRQHFSQAFLLAKIEAHCLINVFSTKGLKACHSAFTRYKTINRRSSITAKEALSYMA